MATRLINHRAPLLLAIVAAAAMLAACGGDKGDKASQTAAKVNKEEITVHQINFVLQRQQGLKPEQAEAASRQVLERLIDQELAVQKAQEQKVDRDPRVVQQIEAAKREIIARAYAERVGETVTKPSAEEVSKYYNDKPALFKERRIYSLQELQIQAKPEQFEAIRAKLAGAKSLNEFAEYLKSADLRFSGNQAVRAAEQLPLASVDAISRMKDGDSMISANPAGLTVLFLVGSRSEPVDESRARPAIEAFLLNQRKAEAIQKDLKALRESSKIEYVGKFAQPAPAGAASAPVLPAATDAAAPAAPAASGLDPASISKGMGLK
ncbi:EpsD family peptidyl-prolyl cis-trans isomerase [Roseateles puraquae]|jgi:EpsD family peptidyl-prolyl cis-trans isomerase|uniref:Peptidyl-prolyl cis-trans isomerase, EpsD family n=1 Tax=Roseateles puraquae TaxID=431059 RepID=A0A254NDG6_9BURK|nr:EpsD family peptidyl-prolyl cis-trans isomerase [Roseateles puraquae]MDG0853991.1 peptidyl-prolyl cis-trans isomerase, EpsD family [Roseateles puraquae]OWR03458.1 peptidyl-prolyl cis-trans isomerase, EpsD family [Roseateles puraquae]